MTAQQLARYIGKQGVVSTLLGTIKVPVIVRDARVIHDVVYLAIVPVFDGEGEAWVPAGKVTLTGGV